MNYIDPDAMSQLEREENDARLALEDARERNERDDGVYEPEHHALIHKLEAEWEHARERLHRARKETGKPEPDGE